MAERVRSARAPQPPPQENERDDDGGGVEVRDAHGPVEESGAITTAAL
jgi:hypothetical protein